MAEFIPTFPIMATRDGIPDLTREHLAERLRAAGADDLKPYLDLLHQTIWMRVEPDREPGLMESRFGGPAMVPDDFVWPTYEAEPHLGSEVEGDTFTVYRGAKRRWPMFLLAQINLAEVPTDSALPRTGLLSFFTDPFDGVWGHSRADVQGFTIRYTPEEAFPTLRPREMPERPDREGAFSGWTWPCYAMRFFLNWAISDADAFNRLIDTERYRDVAKRMGDALREIQGYGFGHFLLDAGMNHQGDPRAFAVLMFDSSGLPPEDGSYEELCERQAEIERRAKQWTTLFSITTDEHLRPVVGDTGGLSFVIRKADLAERRFERAWIVRS